MTDHLESTALLPENAEKSDSLIELVTTQRKQLDRLTLKMIKDACTAQQTTKALDLSKNLYDDMSYEYAYRLAVTQSTRNGSGYRSSQHGHECAGQQPQDSLFSDGRAEHRFTGTCD